MTPELEARLASVEQQVNILRGISAQQMLHDQDTDRHLTMLLGIAKGQEHDIREMKERLSTIESHLGAIEVELHTGFAAMNERFDALMAHLRSTQPKPPEQ